MINLRPQFSYLKITILKHKHKTWCTETARWTEHCQVQTGSQDTLLADHLCYVKRR